jgi:dihydropteroate synthase
MEDPFSPWQTGLGPTSPSQPLTLGILNVTPDSFSDGGRFLTPEAALNQALSLLDQGAAALDLGAESTRPDASPVDAEQEWARLEPVLAHLRAELPHIPLSLDTRHASVAARGLQCGVAVINDVTGFADPELLHVTRNSGCGLIAMRSRLEHGQFLMPPYGLPGQGSARDAIQELACVRDRLLGAGIHPGRILLDPGFGFGLPFADDLALWEALPRLPGALDWPVAQFCLGVSRKRILAWRAGTPALPALERDALTARAHREAALLGYRIFRSHTGDVPTIRLAVAGDAEALAQVQINSWRAAYRGILPAAILDHLAAAPLAGAFRTLASTPPTPATRLWALDLGGRLTAYAATGPCRDEAPGPGRNEASGPCRNEATGPCRNEASGPCRNEASGPCRDQGLAPAATAEIYALYALQDYWGLGLGRALMARVLEGFRDLGFRDAVLWVLERNARAQKFYESAGWRLSGAARTVWQDGIALRECQYRLALDDRL